MSHLYILLNGLFLCLTIRILILYNENINRLQEYKLKKDDNHKLTKKLNIKKEKWCSHYGTIHSPYDTIIYTKAGWLNPGNQSYVNYGYMEEKNIKNWLDDLYDPVIFKSKKHYKELYFLCSIPHMMYINILYEEFLNIEAKYFSVETENKNNLLNRIEFVTKYKILDRFLSYTKYNFKNSITTYIHDNTVKIWIKESAKAEAWGILRSLTLMDIGYYGASNTPTEKENLSWVLDILYYEAILEKYIE